MGTIQREYLFSKLVTFGISAEEKIPVHLFRQFIFFLTYCKPSIFLGSQDSILLMIGKNELR